MLQYLSLYKEKYCPWGRLFVLLITFTPILVHAQADQLQVVSPAGGTMATESMSIDWTIGQIAVATLTTDESMLTQGFHQPMIRVERITEEVAHRQPNLVVASDIEVEVAPNPVQSILNITLKSSTSDRYQLELVDLAGRVVDTQTIQSPGTSAQMSLDNVPAGMYVLRVMSSDGMLIEVFSISKV